MASLFEPIAVGAVLCPRCDAVSFGRTFLANVELTPDDRATWHSQGALGVHRLSDGGISSILPVPGRIKRRTAP